MIKRSFDIVVALAALILSAPLLLAIYVVLWLTIGRPVLFGQRRPGRGGKPFVMRKFRTMRDDRDVNGALLTDEERTPRIGRTLRSTSLDELPELWNVLIGDMSLVGPRPLLVSYLEHYTPEQRRRHEVRPGITGWAQINGRNDLTWEDKLALDVEYVERRSFGLDLFILWKTVSIVCSRQGVRASSACLPPAMASLSAGEILLREERSP